MKLHTLVLALSLLLPSLAGAQQTLKQKLGADFCDALNKSGIDDTWSDANMEKIGMLMVPIAGKYSEQIKKELGLDMTTSEDFQKLGEIIGEEAGVNCPKFKRMIENMVDQSMEQAESYETFEATFVGLETSGNFAFFKVKDDKGREIKVWWLEYFPGSEELQKDPAKFKGKKVLVGFYDRDWYSPTAKDYTSVKVAAGIEIL
jgi:hypothetical protein